MLKEFKQLYAQNKSVLLQFFKWFTLTFLACLIGIYFGLRRMIKDGSMNELLQDIDPSKKNDFLIIATGSYILLAALVSVLVAIYYVVKRNK